MCPFLLRRKEMKKEMLKSCQYCGRVHDTKTVCPRKPVRKKYSTGQNKFRSKNVWTKKSKNIRERDGYLCQICIRKLYKTEKQFNYEHLEVHHIVPMAVDYDLRLEDSNLITLCERHHEMAEAGEIPAKLLREIAEEQMRREG